LVLGTLPAEAQQRFQPPFVTPPRQPLSPHLNLLRGGNPAVNYYLGVLPDQRARALEADLYGFPDIPARRRTGLEDLEDTLPSLPETGHAVRFLNYGPFYNLGTSPAANFLNPQRPRGSRISP
jgi:hypothetical protein